MPAPIALSPYYLILTITSWFTLVLFYREKWKFLRGWVICLKSHTRGKTGFRLKCIWLERVCMLNHCAILFPFLLLKGWVICALSRWGECSTSRSPLLEDILWDGEGGAWGWGLFCRLYQQNRHIQLNTIYRSLKIHTHKAKTHTLQEHIQAKWHILNPL